MFTYCFLFLFPQLTLCTNNKGKNQNKILIYMGGLLFPHTLPTLSGPGWVGRYLRSFPLCQWFPVKGETGFPEVVSPTSVFCISLGTLFLLWKSQSVIRFPASKRPPGYQRCTRSSDIYLVRAFWRRIHKFSLYQCMMMYPVFSDKI